MKSFIAAFCFVFAVPFSASAQKWFDTPIGGGVTILKNKHAFGLCATGAARLEFSKLDPVTLALSFYPSLGLSTDANSRFCYEWPLALEAHFRVGRQTDTTAELGLFGGIGFSHSRLGSEPSFFGGYDPIKRTGLYINMGVRSNALMKQPVEIRLSASPDFVRTGHTVFGLGFVYWFKDNE